MVINKVCISNNGITLRYTITVIHSWVSIIQFSNTQPCTFPTQISPIFLHLPVCLYSRHLSFLYFSFLFFLGSMGLQHYYGKIPCLSLYLLLAPSFCSKWYFQVSLTKFLFCPNWTATATFFCGKLPTMVLSSWLLFLLSLGISLLLCFLFVSHK